MTSPIDAEDHFHRAMQLHAMGRTDEAAPMIRQAADAGSVGAMSLLEVMYRQAIADQGHPSAYNNLAALLAQRGEVAEAEQLYRKAVTLGDGRATANLANLLVREGRPDEAKRLIEEFNASHQ